MTRTRPAFTAFLLVLAHLAIAFVVLNIVTRGAETVDHIEFVSQVSETLDGYEMYTDGTPDPVADCLLGAGYRGDPSDGSDFMIYAPRSVMSMCIAEQAFNV